ncbi:MAG: esterase/lipase family protein, partial [Thermodesulfobacteriota bacterium]
IFVAHSMGGLVVRAFIAHMIKQPASHHSFAPFDISHCVFIGTPHQGTSLATLASHVPGLGRFFKALSDLRPQTEGGWSAPLLHRLEESDIGVDTYIKVGIIAGTSAFILPGRFFISEKNDGMIPLTSAIAPDADAVMLTPFNHVTIHKRNETLKAINCFLTCGHFPQEI